MRGRTASCGLSSRSGRTVRRQPGDATRATRRRRQVDRRPDLERAAVARADGRDMARDRRELAQAWRVIRPAVSAGRSSSDAPDRHTPSFHCLTRPWRIRSARVGWNLPPELPVAHHQVSSGASTPGANSASSISGGTHCTTSIVTEAEPEIRRRPTILLPLMMRLSESSTWYPVGHSSPARVLACALVSSTVVDSSPSSRASCRPWVSGSEL